MDNLELHLGQPFVAHPGEPPSNMLSDFFFGIEDIPTRLIGENIYWTGTSLTQFS